MVPVIDQAAVVFHQALGYSQRARQLELQPLGFVERAEDILAQLVEVARGLGASRGIVRGKAAQALLGEAYPAEGQDGSAGAAGGVAGANCGDCQSQDRQCQGRSHASMQTESQLTVHNPIVKMESRKCLR